MCVYLITRFPGLALGHQGVEVLEWIIRCDFVEGSVSLGWILRFQRIPDSVYFSAYGSGCSSQLLLQHLPACCHAPCHDNGLNL